MNNQHKIWAVFVIAAFAIGILLGYCNKPFTEKVCPEIKDSTIITIVIDTNYFDTTIVHWVSKPVPVPYFDTMYPPEILALIEKGRQAFGSNEDFDQDFILKYPAIYEGTFPNDTVETYYKVIVRGFLDSIKIGWRLRKPFSVTQTDIYRIDMTEQQKKRSMALYIGLDIGGNKDSFNHFKPELSLILNNTSYSVGYNIPDNSITAGAKIKLLPFKR